jgi:CubicO group peptidase (beta-lactamase class C family)
VNGGISILAILMLYVKLIYVLIREHILKSNLAIFLCGFFLCAHVQAASSSNSSAKPLIMPNTDQVLRAIVEHPTQALASLSVLAIKDGKVVYEKQFGRRYVNHAEPAKDVPADVNTLYRIASVSKMVASVGAMILVEQGKLDLDADISRYFGFKVRNPNFPDDAITTRMLLSHTSSLRDDAGYNFPVGVSMQSFLLPGALNYGDGSQWAKSSGEVSKAPGKFFNYVNLNWGMIGSIMEAASGQRFDHFMRDSLLRPLRVAGGYNPEELSPEELSNVAVLYRKKKENDSVWNVAGPWIVQVDDYHAKPPAKRAGLENYVLASNATLFSPQGGLRVSVHGLGRLMQMLMNQGELDGVRVLRAESIQALLSEQWRYDEKRKNGDTDKGLFLAWSLGFQHFTDVSAPHYGDRLVRSSPPFTAFGHLGEAYGLNSGFMFDPKTRNGMIFAIGGLSADSETTFGEYSSLSPWEEKILTALHREINHSVDK